MMLGRDMNVLDVMACYANLKEIQAKSPAHAAYWRSRKEMLAAAIAEESDAEKRNCFT